MASRDFEGPALSPDMTPPSFPLKASSTPKVGGRLSLFWEVWKEKGASPWVVETLREGYRLTFKHRPPLSPVPTLETHYTNPEKDRLIQNQIETLIEKGALEQVDQNNLGLGYYNRLFLVKKKTGKWRPIIDLKRLNKFLLVPKFKMESIQTVWDTLIPNNYTFSLDLKDAYFHIPVHPADRKYFRIYFGGLVFQFRALPFGLKSAPLVFTKVMSEVKAMVHKEGILLILYLDDWLVQICTYQEGLVQKDYLVSLCLQLGLMLNWEKSELIPTQQFIFIGAFFDLINNRVYPKEENMKKLQGKVDNFLISSSVTAKKWQSLLGTMTSQYRFIKWGRLEMRTPQLYLLAQWNQRTGDPYQKLLIPPQIKQSLLWWKDQKYNPLGVPLIPPPFTIRVFTDASKKGWGGHVDNLQFQGLWNQEEQKLHINILEMRAVSLTLQQLLPQPQAWILVSSDNTTVVAYINKEGGTRSKDLMQETYSLFTLVRQQDWNLRATYIPGKLNVIADQLSREGQLLPTEWSLHQEAADILFQKWGKPQIDLFATRFNTKCQLFISPVPDPQAWDVDTLSLSLEEMDGYAYPPHQILSKFLQKIQLTSHCRIILVAPHWPTQIWFPLLGRLSKEPPIQLPNWEKLLKQPRSNVFHYDPSTLDLHAWLITRNP